MKNKKPKLLIIDGNALIHRSFHALPQTMRNQNGVMTNAVYGFTLFLLKTMAELKPEYAVLTLDRKAPTFRHLAYDQYKATRTKAPDDLYEQIHLVRDVATAFNLPIFELDGFEADDLIGTICEQAGEAVDSIITTGDLDTLQLVNDHTFVYTMSRGLSDSVIYDADKVRERFGLNPDQMIDYKGLRGDVSDNLPGVKGIGEKTASVLLQKFGTLENIYQKIDEVDQKTREKLITHKADALSSKKLATIEIHAPIKFKLEDAKLQNFDQQKIAAVFQELEFNSLLKKLPEITPLYGDEIIVPNDKFKRNQTEKQYHHLYNTTDLEKIIPQLKQAKLLAVDTETDSLDPKDAKLLGISLSMKDNIAYYCNLKKTTEPKIMLELLKPILEDPQIEKCAHNAKFDYRVLKNSGIILTNITFDSMIAAYLLNPESRQHSLDAVSLRELGWEKISKIDLLGDLTYDTVDDDKLASYSCEDADCTFQLKTILEEKLAKENLSHVFNDIEMPLTIVLAEMEEAGILVDADFLNAMGKDLKQRLKKLEENIYISAGEKFNVNSTKQLKEILYHKLAIDTKGLKKTKTGISTAADELEKLKDQHAIIPLIQEQRELAKLLSTYITAIPELINHRTNRVHTSFNQTITATGRLSSNNPNLQNIPTRTELGKEIRKAFVAKPGYELLSLDYSQIELRLMAALSKDQKMIAAFKSDKDIHIATAAAILSIPEAEITATMRQEAKAVNFGVIYGQGPHGLSQSAGIPFNQAKEFIEKYFAVYQGVQKYIQELIIKAGTEGYAETAFGRKRSLPDINSQTIMMRKAAERMAVNMPLQGTAADVIKLAMVEINKKIKDRPEIIMLLQVHDELIFEVKQDKTKEWAKIIKTIMESVIDLPVHLRADIAIGQNWGALKDL